MSTAMAVPAEARQIKVWLGEQAFIDHIALDADSATTYEAAMRRRFSSCKVTNDPADPAALLAAAAAGGRT